MISVKLLCSFIEIALRHGCSPVILLHIFRTLFLKNTSWWLLLYSINWPNVMVWLPLHFVIFGNMCTVIICFPVCDVINFEIYLIFVIKPLSYSNRKSGQNLNTLRIKRAIKMTFFIIFKGLPLNHIKSVFWN